MSFIEDLTDGFIKTQKTQTIDELTSLIAGLFDNKSFEDYQNNEKTGPTVLQYPDGLDNTVEYPHRLTFNIVKYTPVKSSTTTQASSNAVLNDVNNAFKTDILTSTEAVITMYHPNSLQTSYENTWNVEALGFIGDAAKQSPNGREFISQAANGIKEQAAQKGLASVSGLLGGKGGEGVQAGLGLVANPRLSIMFQGVTPRTFKLDFSFNPKSEQEVLHTLAIIKLFKYHSAPDFYDASSRAFFRYPDIFEIKSYNGVNENLAMFKYGRCACTNIELDYSPQQVWQTFENGFPVSVNMSLSFNELDIVTKSSIIQGR